MVELNLFRLKLNPKNAYIKKVYINETDTIKKLKYVAYKQDSIFYKEMFISYKNQKDFEKIDFSSLDIEAQEQLLQLFLKKEKRVFDRLSNYIPDKILKGYVVKRRIEGNVFKIQSDFYVSLDIHQSIHSKYTLNLILDKNLIGKEAIVINRNKRVIINSVTFKNEKDYIHKLEIIKSKRDDLKDEAIVGVFFKDSDFKKEFYYFASDLKLSFSIKDIEINLVLSNEERKSLIVNALKQENFCIDSNPLRINSILFDDVKFFGFERIVKFIKQLIVDDTIYPKTIPSLIKGKTIKVLIFVDENLKNVIKHNKNRYINLLFNSLKKISKKSEINFELVNKNEFFVSFESVKLIKKALEYKDETYSIPYLIITLSSNNSNFEYEYLKRNFFKHGFITQNIIYEHLIKAGKYEVNNLILQILLKYGMYPYTISIKHNYDYILGIDVGNDEYGNRRVAGGVSVINKKGVLEKLIPINITTAGENIRLDKLLEEIAIFLSLENKSILLLRDGKISFKETKSIIKEFNRQKLKKITFMNVIKRHNIRIYDDKEGKKGVILRDDLAVVLPHAIKGGRSFKINVKYVVENGEIKNSSITYDDLKLLFELTNLNYSNLYLASKRLRLPAPIHYSDKYVKACGKNFEIDKKLLLEGFLPFL